MNILKNSARTFERDSFTDTERTSEIHVFVDLMRPTVIVVVSGAGADGSRRHIHPCRWVEDPLIDIVGIDTATIDVRQVEGLAGTRIIGVPDSNV